MIVTSRVTRLVAVAAFLLLAWSDTAQAQETPRAYRIGVVSPISAGPTLHAFRRGLSELGYVEGQKFVVETRFADGRSERLPELIAEVISQQSKRG